MSANRRSSIYSLLRGLAVSIVVTLLGMFIIASVVVWVDATDTLLSALNQLLKLISILLGVRACVRRGGSKGFVTGTVLALLYMTLGYSLCAALSGISITVSGLFGEMLLGAAVGGICGAIIVNMNPSRRRKKRKSVA